MVARKSVCALVLVFALACDAAGTGSSRSSKNERIERYRTLLSEYFSMPRHPFTNEENWLYARTGVQTELEHILRIAAGQISTSFEIQSFKTEILHGPSFPSEVQGQNIIATFKGRNWGKAEDQILLVGAHYDSEASHLLSLIDNGSGVVAMLEVARGLADAIASKNSVLVNSVIFVAFDVQRFEHELVGSIDQGAGSSFFVKEKLASLLQADPKPTFTGALILDGVMNFNSSEGSQILPNGYDRTFPDAYKQIKDNNYTGNYVNMVTKERLRSLQLDHAFAQHWSKADAARRFPLITLEVRREPALPALFEFIKQDHTPFWNFALGEVVNPLPAILITDTGKWRGFERICDMNPCNTSSLLTAERMDLLDQVVVTLSNFVSETSLEGKKGIETNGGITSSAGIAAAVLTIAVAHLLQ